MFVVTLDDVKEVKITKVGDVVPTGDAYRKSLVSGKSLSLTRVEFKKGYIVPMHKHQESIGYVIRGKLKMKVGDKDYLLGQGSAWLHPIGVEHKTEALEDTEVVEIFSPPRPEWIQEGTLVI